MAKNNKSAVLVSSAKSGQFVLKDSKKSGETPKTTSASALSQRPKKTSAGSERVIKDVSHEHRDALKRLVDR